MTESLIYIGAETYHFGNSIVMMDMLDKFPSDLLVMGNVDPAETLRMKTPQTVRCETLSIMESCNIYPNFVISSGCDIPPLIPLKNIDTFFGAVKEFYEK